MFYQKKRPYFFGRDTQQGLPDVKIFLNFSRVKTIKFVIIEYNGKMYLRANFEKYHKFVAQKCKEEGLDGIVKGGGFITIEPQSKIFVLTGSSIEFGYADREVVQRLLEPFAKEKGYKIINRL